MSVAIVQFPIGVLEPLPERDPVSGSVQHDLGLARAMLPLGFFRKSFLQVTECGHDAAMPDDQLCWSDTNVPAFHLGRGTALRGVCFVSAPLFGSTTLAVKAERHLRLRIERRQNKDVQREY